MNKVDLKNVDIKMLEDKFTSIPYLHSDALSLYYGLDDEAPMGLTEIVNVIDEIYGLRLTEDIVLHIIEEAVELCEFQEVTINDADRVVTVSSPKAEDIKAAINMQKEYDCKLCYTVTVKAEDRKNPDLGVLDVTLMALNEKGLRLIDEIMGTGYKNKDDIFVRDYVEILANKKDAYLVGVDLPWTFAFKNRKLFVEDELLYEAELRRRFKGADMAILPPLMDMYFMINMVEKAYGCEGPGYSVDEYNTAKNAMAFSAIMLEKAGILPIAGFDSLTAVPSNVANYFYLGQEEAEYAVILDPAYLADKAEGIKVVA